jgi:enoyl-CoA hydratase/carnithine racemase
VGLGRAAEIMLTNRHVPAAEALSIGLVTELATPDDLEVAAGRLAGAMGALSPLGRR